MKPYEVGTGQLEKQFSAFYQSKEWKELRNKLFELHENTCVVCGLTHSLRGDHIKPVRTHWELRLDINNLQILCDECNREKGSKIYWTLEEHKRFKKVKEIGEAIDKLRSRKYSILSGLSEEWRGATPAKPRTEPTKIKPKTEILQENGEKVFRIRDFQKKI
jgi:hypothetical protein